MPRRTGLVWPAVAAGVVSLSLTLHADPARPTSGEGKAAADKAGEPVSVAEARERGRLLHKVYASTLEVMHHHYFRRDRAVLPARALEDVFADLDEQSKIKARWIAVNTPAMSIQHEPETDFEKKAAAAIAGGKDEYDRVEDGYYRRAGAIPLGASCVGCHTRFASAPAKTPRFAGLVISIPVKGK
jgi:hypothetical protein